MKADPVKPEVLSWLDIEPYQRAQYSVDCVPGCRNVSFTLTLDMDPKSLLDEAQGSLPPVFVVRAEAGDAFYRVLSAVRNGPEIEISVDSALVDPEGDHGPVLFEYWPNPPGEE